VRESRWVLARSYLRRPSHYNCRATNPREIGGRMAPGGRKHAMSCNSSEPVKEANVERARALHYCERSRAGRLNRAGRRSWSPREVVNQTPQRGVPRPRSPARPSRPAGPTHLGSSRPEAMQRAGPLESRPLVAAAGSDHPVAHPLAMAGASDHTALPSFRYRTLRLAAAAQHPEYGRPSRLRRQGTLASGAMVRMIPCRV